MCRGMKESGIEWIGEIPEQWSVRKYKSICNIYAGGTPDTNKLELWNGDIPWLPSGKIKNDDIYEADKFITNLGLEKSSTKLIKENTTLLAMTGATCGNVGFLRIKSCANQSVMAFENLNKSFLDRFIYYTLLSQREAILLQKTGGAQSGINVEDGKNLFLPSCSYITQEKIVNYLDKKVSQIDDIISKQKSLIEKYKAYKQSLITETVTKGLNKNVPMKDSGIEWIGEIPTHWSIKKMKYLGELNASGVDKKIRENEKLYKSVHYVNVYKNGQKEIVNSDNYLVISCDDNKAANCTLIQGDVLFTNSSETAGDMGTSTVVAEDLVNTLFGYHLMRFRPYSKVLWYKYEKYLFSSNYMRKWFEYNSVGITRFGLSQRGFSESQIIYAPYEEQIKIADFLDKKCNVIDSAISKKEQLIEKLEEYKKSLIYECVTGKREVN